MCEVKFLTGRYFLIDTFVKNFFLNGCAILVLQGWLGLWTVCCLALVIECCRGHSLKSIVLH